MTLTADPHLTQLIRARRLAGDTIGDIMRVTGLKWAQLRDHLPGMETPLSANARKQRTALLAAEAAEKAVERVVEKLEEEPEFDNETGSQIRGMTAKEAILAAEKMFALSQLATGQATERREIVHSVDPNAFTQALAELQQRLSRGENPIESQQGGDITDVEIVTIQSNPIENEGVTHD